MKIAALILIVLGLGNLAEVFPAIQSGTNLEALFAFVLGGACLGVATGILKKRRFAWPLGFAVILLSALYFVVSTLPFAQGKEGAERVVLLSGCTIGALLVAAGWARVWYKQRGYFTRDEERA